MRNWNDKQNEAWPESTTDFPQPGRDSERSAELLHNEETWINKQTDAPIGVFDSGAGGLTILAALRQELPHESFIYLGDTANCPYGVRSDEEITALTLESCRILIQHGVKLIVIACNTASQAALSTLRATLSEVPFVGVVPAVKPATRLTRKGRIGIAATNQAAKAIYLRQLIDEFAGGMQAFAVGCPELVTLVERGQFEGAEVEQIVRQALQPVLDEDIDVLVLGCTHFPALRKVIEQIAGPKVQVIDSGQAIARRTRSVLQIQGMLAPTTLLANGGGQLEIWCSGDPEAFSSVATTILGQPVHAQQVETVTLQARPKLT
ncbi:MAG TPA: glutamate racemase [Ktedonobacteraceae bacterium]|nr:glutamate racemase [Ktedonobacteraceae bacterium]